MQQRNAMSGKTADTICKQWLLSQGLPLVSSAVLTFGVSLGMVAAGSMAIAADPVMEPPKTILQPDLEPLDVKALQPGNAPAYVVTASRISTTHLTIPSLWWLQEQIANEDTYGGNLLDNWLAYPTNGNQPGRVDLVVNRQFWSLLDYLDRYAFIHAFGEAARDYGYNLRLFDGQATLLGASTCDFRSIDIDALQRRQVAARSIATDPLNTSPPDSLPSQPIASIDCSILLDSSGKSGLSGGSNQLFPGAGAAKALDTGQR